MTAPECIAARTWLSDARDGESAHDARLDAHVAACSECSGWAAAFDQLNRTVRLRSPLPSPAARARVLTAARSTPVSTRDRVATALLAAAAVGMVAAFVLATAGVFGHSHLGTPEGRDSEALMISLAGGFAIAAWRPSRFAVGLLPVAVLAGLVTLVTSAVAVVAGATTLASEIAHLPVLLGAIGTVRAARPSISAALGAAPEPDRAELVHA